MSFEQICLHTCKVIFSTQLNGFNYCYITQIIVFNINDLIAKQWSGYKSYYVIPIIQFWYTVKEFQCIINNLLSHQSFVYTVK